MTENQRKPVIRFAEFTDAWEQRKLGDLADIIGGGTPSTCVDAYWGGDIDWYTPAEIGEKIFLSGSQKKITKSGLENSSAKILPVGTVLFTSRAGIGKTAILAMPGSTNQGFQSIVTRDGILDTYFIYSRSQELKDFGERIGAGSTFVEVSGKQMAGMRILIPRIAEQAIIGVYFKQIDNLITLHQREYDKIVNLKKAMLEKMFPKNGEDRPEIRFEGFTDAWEQRKLNEVACLAKGQQINKTKLSDNGEYYVLNGGMTPSGYTSDYNTPENTISISEGGNSCGFVCYNFSKFWSGGHNYTLSNLKIDTKYLFQFLKLKEPSIMALRVGSGLPNVQKSRLEEVKVSYPSVEEQLMIGAYFIQLDNLITLHQRELKKLQNMKKALLEKMFVQG